MLARQVAAPTAHQQRLAAALAGNDVQKLQLVACRCFSSDNKSFHSSNSSNSPLKASKKPAGLSFRSPRQNLQQAVKTYDRMFEEAARKQDVKYQPNMFKEFKIFNDMDGKVLEASKEPIAVNKAAQVTSLAVKDLQGDAADLQRVLLNGNRTTLLLTSFKNAGLLNLSAWQQTFAKHFANDPRVQVVTLSVVEEWYMWLLKPMVRRNLAKVFAGPEYAMPNAAAKAKQEPASDASASTKTTTSSSESDRMATNTLSMKHLVCFGWNYDFRTVFDLRNSFVGYAHLIDSKGRIRWIAAGQPTTEELDQMVSITQTLLEQSDQSQARKQR